MLRQPRFKLFDFASANPVRQLATAEDECLPKCGRNVVHTVHHVSSALWESVQTVCSQSMEEAWCKLLFSGCQLSYMLWLILVASVAVHDDSRAPPAPPLEWHKHKELTLGHHVALGRARPESHVHSCEAFGTLNLGGASVTSASICSQLWSGQSKNTGPP